MRRSYPDEDTAATPENAAPEPAQDITGVPAVDGEFKRPDAIYFVGERLPTGEPVQHLAGYGIDARDFEKGDPFLARLSDDQVKLALDSGLYRRTKPAASKE